MPLEIIRTEAKDMPGALTVDRRLYLTRDKSRVVEHSDQGAAWLFATPGMQITNTDAAAYGLTEKGGKIVLPSAPTARGDEPAKKPARANQKDETKAPATEK